MGLPLPVSLFLWNRGGLVIESETRWAWKLSWSCTTVLAALHRTTNLWQWHKVSSLDRYCYILIVMWRSPGNRIYKIRGHLLSTQNRCNMASPNCTLPSCENEISGTAHILSFCLAYTFICYFLWEDNFFSLFFWQYFWRLSTGISISCMYYILYTAKIVWRSRGNI